mgnify:CR=1 FL=1
MSKAQASSAAELPVGLEIHRVHWMSDVVADSTAYPLFVAGTDTFWGLAYADTMTFRLDLDAETGPVPAAAPVPPEPAPIAG